MLANRFKGSFKSEKVKVEEEKVKVKELAAQLEEKEKTRVRTRMKEDEDEGREEKRVRNKTANIPIMPQQESPDGKSSSVALSKYNLESQCIVSIILLPTTISILYIVKFRL